MRNFLRAIALSLLHLGGLGLLVFGILDSSFVALPLGNDLLVVALTARHHAFLPYYAFMAAAGSVIGCAMLIYVTRHGRRRLRRRASNKHLEHAEFIEEQVHRHAGWAVGIAALMPPPFPFTPVVAAATMFNYPRRKLLTIIAIMRLVRFAGEGALAIRFGPAIIGLTRSKRFEWVIVGFIVLAGFASAYSLLRWVRRSREPEDVVV